MAFKTLSPMRHLLIVAILLLGTQAVSATDNECGGRAAAIVKAAYPSAKASGDGFAMGNVSITLPALDADSRYVLHCRVWPEHPERLLVAVPLIAAKPDGGIDGDLELLVLDNASLKVLQRLRMASRMSGNSPDRVSAIAFDTARYRLTSNQMAFGLRVTSEHSGGINYESVDLGLYIIENAQLRPVLDGFNIAFISSSAWSVCKDQKSSDRDFRLTMDTTSHNGYADIVVTEKFSESSSVIGKDGQCKETDKNGTKNYRLLYDGIRYANPDLIL